VTRARRWASVVVGGALVAFALTSAWQGASAQASDGPNFGSYSVTATAPGFEMWEDEPSANAHPEGGGQAPYSTSMLSSGGLGYGLASVAWPGATEANADKVALLLFPHDVGGVPIPDAVVGAVQQGLPLASYPLRAEARTGSPSPDSTLEMQAGTLKAHADALLANATATMKGAAGSAGFTFGNAETIANTVLAASGATATADSKITKLDIGGVIKIDSITSTATASTDGATGTSSGVTVVHGMTIAGQPAYVDEQGVHLGEQGQPANAVVSQIANQALTQGGFSFYVAQPQQEQAGAASSYTAGSLIIVWKPPGNPSENMFFISLGGSRVAVSAAPGIDFGLTPSVAPPSATGSPASSTPVRTGGITSAPITSANAPAATRPAPSVATAPIASTFAGLGGQAALGLIGAAMLFFGFRRVADDVIDRVPSTCPLETT
jgi:hypothetical protein